MEKVSYSQRGQAQPARVLPVTEEAFKKPVGTEIRWLGSAGILINARGTAVMIDPLLEGFDMPLLFEPPLLPQDVPAGALDAVLISHIDNDHFSRSTCLDLCARSYHAPHYVAEEICRLGLPGVGHAIGESFSLASGAENAVTVTLTPALHNWQSESLDFSYRVWKEEDYCGYRIETPDGRIWLPGDSRLLPEHLTQPEPDVILFDFSDNDWHITFEGAVRLANAYPLANLICIHWGSVDAPDMTPFNGDPLRLLEQVDRPERVRILYPGEVFTL